MKYGRLVYSAVAALSMMASAEEAPLVGEVDGLVGGIEKKSADFKTVAVIDHARLAEKAGEEMPPSVLLIFSDPAVNTPLVKANPLLGLDLPLKLLAYAEPGAASASVAFAGSDYLMKRHSMENSDQFSAYRNMLATALNGIPEEQYAPVRSNGMEKGFGLVEMQSDFPFAETIARIKAAVMSQGDTVWFGSVDYQADAAAQGVEIPGAVLLLFGGPKPGGLAMAQFPKLGLDAFCQKLLVYEDAAGSTKIAFNDIVAFAELHYDGASNKPQQVINARLVATFEKAIQQKGQN